LKLPPYKDEALLVAHLLGGRYGFEPRREQSLMERVAEAINVAREIRRQLAELDKTDPDQTEFPGKAPWH
jgi:hypothetical protein